jgi:hypothetical protein
MPPVSYHQARFPPLVLDWPALIPLLGPAAAAIARYDGMLAAIPNATARRFLRVLTDAGILRQVIGASGRRAAVHVFPALLNLAEGKDTF